MVLPALSGLFLILIFPRFNLELLAWFSLVPLFFAIQNQPLHRVLLYGFTAGMVFYFFGLHWVTNTIVNYGHLPLWLSYIVLLLLAAYLSLYLALFCYLTVRLSRGSDVYFFLLAPMIWTALEYVRSTHGELAFSWMGLGYSQFQTLPIIQMAEFTGVYGISWLIVVVNAAVYLVLKERISRKDEKGFPGGLVRILGVSSAIVIFWLAYGLYALDRWQADAPEKYLQVGLAQGNIEQHMKWDPRFRNKVMKNYRDLTLKGAESKPDLIVWPEAATPFFFALNEEEGARLRDLVKTVRVPLLFGSPHQEKRDNGPVLFNRAYLLSAEGNIAGHYDKIHLVPFGEFVPFKWVLGFVEKMVEGVGDFGRGTEPTLFDLNGGRFAVSICYEITFPDLVRRPVKNGAGFLVNITNDAWFGKSAASYQHMSMAALRAVENRVPIVRAANTGISGAIDPSGEMRQTTELFVRELVLTRIAPKTSGTTYYTRYGDVFSYMSIIAVIIIALMARKIRRENI